MGKRKPPGLLDISLPGAETLDHGSMVIAFDADDTLWVNEPIYTVAQIAFNKIIHPYLKSRDPEDLLYQVELKNLKLFGYGIKGFIISMIETAIEVSSGVIPASDIKKILHIGKDMIQHPIELLRGVDEVLRELSKQFDLMMITKGDLFDQESKIARSGLAEYFRWIEIVTEKNQSVYSNILKKYNLHPSGFIMVGNSKRSDILPVNDIGCHAVYIPFHTTWQHELVTPKPISGENYTEIPDIRKLPDYIFEFLNEGLESPAG